MSQSTTAQRPKAPRPKAQRGYIVIHEDRCKGCDLCIPECPVEIISKVGSDRVNWMGWLPVEVLNDEMKYCIACNLCAMICPDQAIEVFRFAKPVPHEALAAPAAVSGFPGGGDR
jgi:2-oxoglutarate ferredoxin oxidoreductase subunit delta